MSEQLALALPVAPILGLDVGMFAWTMLWRDFGKAERKELAGCAYVRVVELIDEHAIVCVLVRDSRGPTYLGTNITRARATLYAEHIRAEHNAFGELVSKFWAEVRP